MSGGDLRFRLFGIPVRIHPFFWLVTLILALRPDTDGKSLVIWVLVVAFSILVHEFGHVAAFVFYGQRARVVLYAMGGLAIPDEDDYRRQWRPAQTTDGWQQIVISLAGPVAGFLLAGLVIAGLYIGNASSEFLNWKVGHGEWIRNDRLAITVYYLLQVNVLWGVLNLFPIYPLDGGHVARELLLMVDPRTGIRRSLWLSVAAGVVLAVGMLAWRGFDGIFGALMFGSLAYSSYAALKQYDNFGGGYGGSGYGGGWRDD